ncbi:signal peptidase II [Bosea sp. UC22_33]|uniref:signal peptidase II n=1 Tax=Bosea sp. UC22_33 TaxID=3350165 RepID=UPI00366AAC09
MTPARRLGLIVVLVVFVADQLLKSWLLYSVRLAENGPYDLTSFLTIVLAWNRGISYGLFQQGTDLGRWFLVVISFVAAVWLWRWMWREPQRFSVFSLALIIGGALGNGVDRAVYGAVVDFVHFHWGSFSWYIFNIADVAIVVGVLGLLYESFRPTVEKAA